MAVLCICLVCGAQNPANDAYTIPKTLDPWNIQNQVDWKRLYETNVKNNVNKTSNNNRLAGKIALNGAKALRRADGATVDTVAYFVAAQNYKRNYTFTYNGGDVETYNLKVAVDGTKVTFKNLLDLYDPTSWSPDVEYEVVGTYDADAKTITVPTSTNFSNATIAAYLMSYYYGVLMSGTVDEEGNMSPSSELVFNVEGDFEAISTDQAFGVATYTQDGSQSYGMYKTFRRYYAALPKAGSKLIAFNNSFEFGTTFPDTPVSDSITVVNVGNDATDFAVALESDGDAYTANPVGATVEGQSAKNIVFTFNATDEGDYEGIASIEYENGSEETEPILVQLNGSITGFPDYSPIVKSGDITFTTNIEYPFELDTLTDGTVVAASTTGGIAGASSKLNAKFTVPEGHIGKFSWKGRSINSAYWYYNAGGVFIDDASEAYISETGSDVDVSDELEFAPGEHTVRFQYDSYYYSGVDANRLYVYDLVLENTEAKADTATLDTPVLDFGNFIVDGEEVSSNGLIQLTNKGSNTLKVTAVSSDNSSFTVGKPSSEADLLESLSIPVVFSTTTAGEYSSTITIETTAGTFYATAKAFVRQMPDFSKIVTEGAEVMTFSTNTEHPFIVDGDVAYNANADEIDYEFSDSWFQINFTIPEGKAGYLSWDGHSYGGEIVNYNYYYVDYSNISIQHPMSGGTFTVWGNAEASSDSTYAADEFWEPYLTCTAGDHYIKFDFYQAGDSTLGRLEIKNLKLHIVDFDAHGAELMTESVKFDSTYVGPQRYTTATVRLKNTGSEYLKVDSIPAVGPFYGIEPTDSVAFSNNMDITLWFYPSDAGVYNDSITIYTNAGAFKVACEGVAKSSEGLLLIGDVEDQGYNWAAYDADGDGYCWNLGYNLFGGYYPDWCHGGNDCFGSASMSPYSDNLTPDNWLISPSVTVPADGAVLEWYAGSHSHNRPAEKYSVYVGTYDEISDVTSLTSLEALFTETLEYENADVWSHQTLDLTNYAGQTVYICFRHHDTTGQYVLKLDDIFVYTKDAWDTTTGINNAAIDESKTVVRRDIFDLSGAKTSGLSHGINLIRTYYNDGTVKTSKILVK